MFDWQTITAGLIILAATLYLGRLVWARLRSFSRGKSAASCATGCGGCGEDQKPPATERIVFVEISRSKTSPRR